VFIRVLSIVAILYVVFTINYFTGPHTITTHLLSSEDRAKELMVLLECVAPILDEHEVPWYIDFGTLLGAVRRNELIPGDEDIDVSVLRTYDLTDRMKKVQKAVNNMNGPSCQHMHMILRGDSEGELLGNSIFPICTWTCIRLTYARIFATHPVTGLPLPLFVDIAEFDFDAVNNIIFDQHLREHKPAAQVFLPSSAVLPIAQGCTLYGRPVNCPSDPAAVLRGEYGVSWETPQPGVRPFDFSNKEKLQIALEYNQQQHNSTGKQRMPASLV